MPSTRQPAHLWQALCPGWSAGAQSRPNPKPTQTLPSWCLARLPSAPPLPLAQAWPVQLPAQALSVKQPPLLLLLLRALSFAVGSGRPSSA